MKDILLGFVMSVGMFSVIPAPASAWNDKSMPYTIPFFPLVGVLIGGLWHLVISALTRFTPAYIYASFLCAAVIALCPFFLSGFIHADGFLDTADAVFSRRERQEKIRILKDPHMGAFAAVSLCVLVLLHFCAVMDLLPGLGAPAPVFILLPVVSRCVSGLALMTLKPLSETGFAASFKKGTGAGHIAFVAVTAGICFIVAFISGGLACFIPVLTAVIFGVLTAIYLYRQFGGVSGDLCGAIVVIGELAGVVCAALYRNFSYLGW